MNVINNIIDGINSVLWGNSSFPWFLQAGIVGLLLIGLGIYFTIRLRVIQVRRFPDFFRVLGGSFKADNPDGISPFAAFATSLAARVGAGNIAGVAIAVTLGGPGAVFWMWIVALIGMSTAMVEATLAQIYKQRDPEETRNTFRGGPAYYMERGLGSRPMGVLFSVFLIIAFPFVFSAVQANTLADAMQNSFGVPPVLVGAVVAVLTALVIFGGVKRITKFAEVVMPALAFAYLLVGVVVIGLNIGDVPDVLADIVRSAFGPQQAAGGFAGYAVAQAVVNGVKRGLFSNEAGLGSAPNAAAVADTKHPANQGFIQALGVFVDTIVVCTVTALIILMSDAWVPGAQNSGIGGAPLTQNALAAEVGAWGSQFVAIMLVFFCFTSVIANYYYGETSLLFIKGDHRLLVPLRATVVVVVFLGALAEVAVIWNFADTALGLMALVNLLALVRLAKYAIPVLRDYERQRSAGHDPEFDVAVFPDLARQVEPGVWDRQELRQDRG